MNQFLLFFFVFARVGAFITFVPIFSNNVPLRVRILLSFFLSTVVYSYNFQLFISQFLIKDLFFEIFIGCLFGFLVNIYFIIANIISTIIGMQTGLSSYSVASINSKEQGLLLNNFLFFIIALAIFSTNIHHIFIKAIIKSYNFFPIGAEINIEDWCALFATKLSQIFSISFTLAGPCVLIHIITVVCAGIISRVIPMLQVFFFLSPIQIAISIIVLAASLPLFVKKIIDLLNNFNH